MELGQQVIETNVQCAEEPIRVPGSIQPHGFFLLTDGNFEKVLVASENAAGYLGQPLKLILGARMDAVLGREVLFALEATRTQRPEMQALTNYLGSFRVGENLFSVMTHAIGNARALEFEEQDRLVGPEMMNSIITNFVSTLGRLQNAQDLCDSLTEQMAELTGFDRVLLYSFNEAGDGTVLSEVNNGRLPSYLGLRFPATDIPQQARALYVLNTTRIIPNANYVPSPLAGSTTRPASQLDLSQSVLRSVSPVHLQYMRNMGTGSSMSVSIVLEGKLWGLVSCHHATPKLVPYLIRSACDMLTKMAATQLMTFHSSAQLREMVSFHNAQRELLTTLAGAPNYVASLRRQTEALARVTNSAGVAVLLDGEFTVAGLTPDTAALERLVDWLEEDETREVFASSHLSAELPWAEAIAGPASGVLAVRASAVQRRYVLWFRPELVTTVRWAGEPVKHEDEQHRLTPRASFAQWKETVRGQSQPWTAMEIESATEFRAALTTIGLRRAEEAMELGEARFQQLTQALPVKVFTVDDAGCLTYVNERWRESGLPTKGAWFDHAQLQQDDRAACREGWQEAVKSGQPFGAEVRQLMGDAPERWNYVRIVPFQRAGAARAGWVGTMVDLTESKEREMAMRMSEKLALTGRMTSVIAHEINNPLEAITNLMYLLRGEQAEDGPSLGYIDLVESELERIGGITKQTLRWNRENSEQNERFSLDLLIEDVMRLFAGKIRNRQLRVTREGPEELEGWGMLGQVRQVLANLVSNAIDAAPVGGTVTLRVLEGVDGEFGFAVEDNGAGMSAATQKRLFEPFFSTKGDLGNGLGLYISREIIERHEGRMEVRSVIGKGTTMTVRLPRGPVAET